MPKLSRRKLLVGAAPLVAAPALGKLAFGGGNAAAAGEDGHRHLEDHVHNHAVTGHAAMIGEQVPAVGGPERPRRAPLPAAAAARTQPGRVREYTLRAIDRELEIAPGVFFPAWTYNGTVPGPVIRATEGDMLRVNFVNAGSHPHTIHFHGIHPANMDGVFEVIPPGGDFTYEFEARPAGFHLYHCHATPLKKHIHKGLYGAFIVDPAEPRPRAQELVMVMNGYDTDARRRQQLLHRQRAQLLLRALSDSRAPLGARAHLPREPDRVRPDQLAAPARRLLPLPADRHGRLLGVHRHRSCSARASAG